MALHVNFSDKEASSEARSLLPIGEYHVKITDVELRSVGSGTNEGKPYWNLEFTIQEGEYAERKVWTNCMLFEGALYTASQLFKSLGYDVTSGSFAVPDEDELVGKDVVVRLKKKPAQGDYEESREVGGIKPWKQGVKVGAGKAGSSKSGSLLP